MRTGIVGSRGFEDSSYLAECMDKHPVRITTIVSGGAKRARKRDIAVFAMYDT